MNRLLHNLALERQQRSIQKAQQTLWPTLPGRDTAIKLTDLFDNDSDVSDNEHFEPDDGGESSVDVSDKSDIVVDKTEALDILNKQCTFSQEIGISHYQVRLDVAECMGDVARLEDIIAKHIDVPDPSRGINPGCSNTVCPVCLEVLSAFDETLLASFDCGHQVCVSCLSQYLATLQKDTISINSFASHLTIMPVRCFESAKCPGVLYREQARFINGQLLARSLDATHLPCGVPSSDIISICRIWEWYAEQMDKHFLSCVLATCSNESCAFKIASRHESDQDRSCFIFPAVARGQRQARRVVICGCLEETCFDPELDAIREEDSNGHGLKQSRTVRGCREKAHDPLSCHARKILSRKVASIETSSQIEVKKVMDKAALAREEARRTEWARQRARHRIPWMTGHADIVENQVRIFEEYMMSFAFQRGSRELNLQEVESAIIHSISLLRADIIDFQHPALATPIKRIVSTFQTSIPDSPKYLPTLLRRLGRHTDADKLDSILQGSAPSSENFLTPTTREEQEAASEALVAKVSKPCPNPACMANVVKDQGCNHMQCKMCKWDFCWMCLSRNGCKCRLSRRSEIALPSDPGEEGLKNKQKQRRLEDMSDYDPQEASRFLKSDHFEEEHVATVLSYANLSFRAALAPKPQSSNNVSRGQDQSFEPSAELSNSSVLMHDNLNIDGPQRSHNAFETSVRALERLCWLREQRTELRELFYNLFTYQDLRDCRQVEADDVPFTYLNDQTHEGMIIEEPQPVDQRAIRHQPEARRAELLKWAREEQGLATSSAAEADDKEDKTVVGDIDADTLLVKHVLCLVTQEELERAESLVRLWVEAGGDAAVQMLFKELALWRRLSYNVALYALGRSADAHYGQHPLVKPIPPLLGSVSQVIGHLAETLSEPTNLDLMLKLTLVPDSSSLAQSDIVMDLNQTLDVLSAGADNKADNKASCTEALDYLSIAGAVPSPPKQGLGDHVRSMVQAMTVDVGECCRMREVASRLADRLRASRSTLCSLQVV